MAVLSALVAGLASGSIDVVDLTAPLSSDTPILQLPASSSARRPASSWRRSRRYDDARPGLVLEQLPHRRAHRHALRRADPLGHRARTARTSRRCRPSKLIAPAAVLDFSAQAARKPRLPPRDRRHQGVGEAARPAARPAAGCSYRTGWDARAALAGRVPQRRRDRPAHARACPPECARWVAEESPVIGMGVETVGTDAGAAATLRPAVPVPLVHARRGTSTA